MRLFIIFILIHFVFYANSQTVKIYGNAPDYASKNIIFTKYSDLITFTTEKLDSCIVSPNGDFSCEFNLSETCQIKTILGIYDCSFYAEPNKQYEVIFPPLIEKKLKDSLNPYFKPFKMELGIKNLEKNDLNILIQKFDKRYKTYLNMNFNEIFLKRQHSNVDSMINAFNKYFDKYDNQYFKIYKRYKIEFLRHVAYTRDIKWVTYHHYRDNPVYYMNTAYMDLFTKMYNNFFVQFANSKEGKTIYSDVNLSKSSNVIKKTLGKRLSLSNDTLQELVVLKGLNDVLSNPAFKNRFVLQALDTLIRYSKIPQHIEIAKNIKKKATAIKTINGTNSPDFNLYDGDSNLVGLKDFRGKYVYLNFVVSDAYSCMQDYGLLKNLHKKHKTDFDIITVFIDLYPSEINDFVETIIPRDEKNPEVSESQKWTFLSCKNNQDLLNKYRVLFYPTYILIDPYGKIIAAPTRTPNENFERYFFRVLRSRG